MKSERQRKLTFDKVSLHTVKNAVHRILCYKLKYRFRLTLDRPSKIFFMRKLMGMVEIFFALCCLISAWPVLAVGEPVMTRLYGFSGQWVYLPAVAPVGAQRPRWQEPLQETNCRSRQGGEGEVHMVISKRWGEWELRFCWWASSVLQ